MKGEQEAAAAASFGRVTHRLPQGRITLAWHWSFPRQAPTANVTAVTQNIAPREYRPDLALSFELCFQHRLVEMELSFSRGNFIKGILFKRKSLGQAKLLGVHYNTAKGRQRNTK